MKNIAFKIAGEVFHAELEDNSISELLVGMCPLELMLERSGSHEYYAELPKKDNVRGCEAVSAVHAGEIYYFEGWNALSIVFADKDIAPYKVHYLGRFQNEVTDFLKNSGSILKIRCEKEM